MNPDLDRLQPYPFQKLNTLKAQVQAPEQLSHIALSIGEPKHQPPAFIAELLRQHEDKLATYPKTAGIPELKQAIADWLKMRFQLHAVDADSQILPVNGTREALFAFTQAVVDRSKEALVICPNPFYQIYEGAAYLAGAEPYFLPCLADNDYLPDYDAVPDSVWQRCQLLFVCSPGNPTGAVTPLATLQKLIKLAEQHDFIIASDECYSELYFDPATKPPGLLEAAQALGNHGYQRCVAFHSLSKRSNLPGLRSGFVAGDADIMAAFLLYRTYHGCAMPEHVQLASAAAWRDEQHVVANQQAYNQKFDQVVAVLQDVLPVQKPQASFYLWPKVPDDDALFAQKLFAEQHITVLPGSYLSRNQADGSNPGQHHIRIALVAELEQCLEAAQRIKTFMLQHYG